MPVFDLPIRFDVMKPGERWTYRQHPRGELGLSADAMPC
jgi:hypothetical protein